MQDKYSLNIFTDSKTICGVEENSPKCGWDEISASLSPQPHKAKGNSNQMM